MKLKDSLEGAICFFFVVLCLFLGDSLLHCGAFMFVGSFWFGVECVVCFFFSMFGLRFFGLCMFWSLRFFWLWVVLVLRSCLSFCLLDNQFSSTLWFPQDQELRFCVSGTDFFGPCCFSVPKVFGSGSAFIVNDDPCKALLFS